LGKYSTAGDRSQGAGVREMRNAECGTRNDSNG
jgi:hypothetical protein